MTATPPSTRRPLAPAVYWRRRLFVAGVVLALVLIAINVVRGGPEQGAAVQARTASAEQSSGATASEPSVSATGPAADPGTTRGGRKARKGAAEPAAPSVVLPTAPPLAEPEGECSAHDLAVTPTVQNAVAGRTATIVLGLRTETAPACTWEISAASLVVKISVGEDRVWASWECPDALPEESVVVRRDVTSTYRLTWNTRRSDDGCPPYTEYAQPGDYRVSAAALGGEPADLVFDLPAPTAPAPTPSPTPAAAPGADRLKDVMGNAG